MTTPHDKDRILREAYTVLAFAFNRIHGLPRTRDSELASDIGKVRGKIEKALGHALHAPIEAGNGGDGWLDMSSAPKRGQILLALPSGAVREGYWGAGRYNRKTKDYEYAWVTHPSSGDVKPTHWRPLPQPPSTPSHEGREKA